MVSVRWSGLGALCLVACSFETADSQANVSPVPEATSGRDTDSTTQDLPGSSSEAEQTSEPGSSTSNGETSESTETGDLEIDPACPQPLPESWVLCEDFEDVTDLNSEFAGVSGSGLSIGGPGYESLSALQITHFAQQQWSGELRIRFGEGPQANNVVEPDQQFDELWVRMRFRASEGWPVGGPGDLLSIDGVDDSPGWAATFKARISADQAESSIRNSAFTCFLGDEHPCVGGSADWEFLRYLGGQLGAVPVFDASVVEDWHCAVLHARLNTPNNADGLFEVVVDGQPDGSLTNLNFRGWHSDLGFNLISIPTFIEAALQDDHRRYIDDVVISSAALHCE